MKKIRIITIMIIVLLCMPTINYSAQNSNPKPSISYINNIDKLADYLLEKDDDGLIIENIRYKDKSEQIGHFKNVNVTTNDEEKIPGFDNINNGIVFSSGDVKNPNIFSSSGTFVSNGFSTDGWEYGKPNEGQTYDKAVLYFDVISNTDSVSFRYIFASEEFDQPPVFNDYMYIGYKEAGKKNADFKNVSINPNYEYEGQTLSKDKAKEVTINNLRNTKYHYDNIKGKNFAFLGYTPLLTCKASVEPGKKYTFCIAITDVGDPIYDSAIFLKSHSFTSKEPPPSEENPNPSTREILEVKKEISAVKITSQIGNVLNAVEIKENKNGIPYITDKSAKATLLLNNNSLKKVIDDLIVSVDPNALYGARLEIEYNIKMQNTSSEGLIINSIIDTKDEKLDFRDSYELITESGNNKKYKWKLQSDGTIKMKGEKIAGEEEINKKIVLVRNLANIDEDFEPYKNRIVVNYSYEAAHSKDTSTYKKEIQSKAGEIILLTPTGKNKTTEVIECCYVEGILFLIAIYVQKKNRII